MLVQFAQQELKNLTASFKCFLVVYMNISIHPYIRVYISIYPYQSSMIFHILHVYVYLKQSLFFSFFFLIFVFFQHQLYIPSSSHHSCCGTCQNVSCSFLTENGTQIVYEVSTSGEGQKISVMI